MTGVGIALLLAGVALVIAEAHIASAGVLGAVGTAAAVAGTAIAIHAAGGGLALAVSLAVLIGVILGAFLLVAGMKVARTAHIRPRSGREAMHGVHGHARTAIAPSEQGQVMVDGALWRARTCFDNEIVEPGDEIVVERIDGLTLTVRKAESWELTP
jgi:membrane-bound ClpP family serine protease